MMRLGLRVSASIIVLSSSVLSISANANEFACDAKGRHPSKLTLVQHGSSFKVSGVVTPTVFYKRAIFNYESESRAYSISGLINPSTAIIVSSADNRQQIMIRLASDQPVKHDSDQGSVAIYIGLRTDKGTTKPLEIGTIAVGRDIGFSLSYAGERLKIGVAGFEADWPFSPGLNPVATLVCVSGRFLYRDITIQ